MMMLNYHTKNKVKRESLSGKILCKRIKHSVGLENCLATGFSTMGGLVWYSPLSQKSSNLDLLEAPHEIFILTYKNHTLPNCYLKQKTNKF